MKEDIHNYNDKGELHGYQQGHDHLDNLWYRGCYKNGNEIGYTEENQNLRVSIGDEGTEVKFYIR